MLFVGFILYFSVYFIFFPIFSFSLFYFFHIHVSILVESAWFVRFLLCLRFCLKGKGSPCYSFQSSYLKSHSSDTLLTNPGEITSQSENFNLIHRIGPFPLTFCKFTICKSLYAFLFNYSFSLSLSVLEIITSPSLIKTEYI